VRGNIYVEDHSTTMADYRAYILDGAGDILLSEELVASSDAAAITAGLEIAALYGGTLPAQGVELWSAGRLVFSTHPRG
jgi:hypothetical protein